MLLTHRKLLQSKTIAIENHLRGTLRNFGLKVGMVGKVKFETRIKELVEGAAEVAKIGIAQRYVARPQCGKAELFCPLRDAPAPAWSAHCAGALRSERTPGG